MNRLRKNGALLVWILIAVCVPIVVRALEPNPEGKTAGERLEEIRLADQEEAECRAAVDNAESLIDGGGSGDYVPVHETGDLLDAGKKSTSLSFQICMFTKTLKRIQYEWEEKELITNPDARKASAKEIGELRKGYFYGDGSGTDGIAQKQYYTTQEEEAAQKGQPIYITNTAQHIKSVSTEAEGLFLKDLNDKKNQNPIFTNVIERSIAERSAVNQDESVRLQQLLKSDFASEQEFNDFTSDFNKGGWDAWLKIIQPNNNPYGQYLIAKNELNVRKQQAEQNAREEILAGGGFLPNRECQQWDSIQSPNGTSQQQYCRRWKVLTPANAQSSQYNQLWGSTLAQAINADEQIEDFIKDELPVEQERLINGIGSSAAGQATSIFDSETDPCPGPGPCVITGWTGESSLGGLTGGGTGGNPLGNLMSDGDRDGIPDYLFDNQDLYQDLAQRINEIIQLTTDTRERMRQIQQYLTTVPPSIEMSVTTPTLQDIANNVPNQSRITWKVFNATECRAANDWYAGGARQANNYWEGTFTVKKAGDTLARSGNNTAATIKLPVQFPVDFINTQQGDPNQNPNSQTLRATRGMISHSEDAFRLAETVTISASNAQGENSRQAHDLIIGGLDGRWDNATQRATGDRPAIHVPTAPQNACANQGQYGASKLVASLRNEIARRVGIPSDSAEAVLKYFNISYVTNDVCQRTQGTPGENASWNSGSITITPQLRYGMTCYNTNQAPNNFTYKEVTITR